MAPRSSSAKQPSAVDQMAADLLQTIAVHLDAVPPLFNKLKRRTDKHKALDMLNNCVSQAHTVLNNNNALLQAQRAAEKNGLFEVTDLTVLAQYGNIDEIQEWLDDGSTKRTPSKAAMSSRKRRNVDYTALLDDDDDDEDDGFVSMTGRPPRYRRASPDWEYPAMMRFDRTFKDGVFKCFRCAEEFTKVTKLKMHVRTKHTRQASEFVCIRCGVSYANGTALARHMCRNHHDEVIHPETRRWPKRQPTRVYAGKGSMGPVVLRCAFCPYSTRDKEDILDHRINKCPDVEHRLKADPNKPVKFEAYTIGMGGTAFRVPRGSAIIRAYPCTECKKVFKTTENRLRHLSAMHDGGKHARRSYECTICGCAFTKSTYHRRHIQAHKGLGHVPPEKMEKESSEFCRRLSQPVLHVGKSKKDRAIRCSDCPKKFCNRTRFNLHQRAHYPYKKICIKCGQHMPKDNEDYYRNHLATVHNLGVANDLKGAAMKKRHADKQSTSTDTTNADLSCKDCSFTCADRSMMVAHRLAGCETAKMTWAMTGTAPSLAASLVDVQVKKSGESKEKSSTLGHVQCNQCRLYFANNGQLLQHQYYEHNNMEVLKFACTFPGCNRRFARIDTQRTHVKAHQTGILRNRDKPPKPVNPSMPSKNKASEEFACVFCTQVFKRKHLLQQHIEVKHMTGIDPEFKVPSTSKRRSNKGGQLKQQQQQQRYTVQHQSSISPSSSQHSYDMSHMEPAIIVDDEPTTSTATTRYVPQTVFDNFRRNNAPQQQQQQQETIGIFNSRPQPAHQQSTQQRVQQRQEQQQQLRNKHAQQVHQRKLAKLEEQRQLEQRRLVLQQEEQRRLQTTQQSVRHPPQSTSHGSANDGYTPAVSMVQQPQQHQQQWLQQQLMSMHQQQVQQPQQPSNTDNQLQFAFANIPGFNFFNQ